MKLYLNKDIAPDSAKMRYWMTGDDAVSHSDISAFLNYMAEYAPGDNTIDLEIHSCGGDCTEGWAIYDALRASGKEISACVVGQCASMATIILLAAPAERRKMYEHAQLLIHEPYYPAVNGEMTIDKLEEVRAALQHEKERMMAVYKERTGTSEEALLEQVASGDWFGAERALELGFISSVVPAISAAATGATISTTQTQNKSEMKINENSAMAKAFIALGRAMGVIDTTDAPAAMTITDVNGTEIEIEREEGEPQVGDTTTAADGEYTLEDGRVIVVEGGVITDIKAPEEETDEEAEASAELDALRAEVAELRQQLEAANSAAMSEEQRTICEAVASLGGIDKVKAMAVGSFQAPARQQQTPQASAAQAHLNERLAQVREEQNAKRKNK